MDSDQAIRGGSDMMLKNFDMQTNHLTDQTSATGVLAMRNASHDILYTTVNSRAYDAANLNMSAPAWRTMLTAADVIIVLLAAALFWLNWKRYRKAA